MKKIISLTFVLSLLFFSCSSNENEDNSNSGIILLRKTIETNSQGVAVTTNFNYNGNKIVNATSNYGVEYKFYYTGDLITKYEIYDNNSLIHTRLYNYNSQNNLISSIELNHDNNQGTNIVLTYNSNGTITYNMYSGDLITQTSLWGTFTATLSNNEITMFKDESSNITYTYTYDSKNNHFKNILGYEKVKMGIGSGTYVNISGIFQNLTQRRATLQNGNQYIQETNQCSYNVNDFPVTSNTNYYSSNGTIINNKTVSFYYE